MRHLAQQRGPDGLHIGWLAAGHYGNSSGIAQIGATVARHTEIHLGDYAAVVFDKDGVLADSENINVTSTVLAFAEFDVALPETARALIVGRHPDDFLGELAGDHGFPAASLPELSHRKAALYAELWAEQGKLCPGAAELLGRLTDASVPLGICTSATAAELGEFIDRFGLRGTFAVALSRNDVARPKPAPDIYLLAANRLGMTPQRMLVIEDSSYGISAARAAGAHCIALCPDGVAPPDLGPDLSRVASLHELEIQLFGGLAG